MISKKEFQEEEKDCADMLGMNIEEYHNDLKNTKIPTKDKQSNNYSYDNSILNYLGFDESYLKKRKHEV